ncbi:MAG: hypothetical protein IT501_04775 [Rubrivivax sp.]|nr:hypothetical protein [Rubrivivax sp.]
MKPLQVKMTIARDGGPLAVLDLPGDGAELRPQQLRDLAAALVRVAGDCEGRKLTHRGRPIPDERRSYQVKIVGDIRNNIDTDPPRQAAMCAPDSSVQSSTCE